MNPILSWAIAIIYLLLNIFVTIFYFKGFWKDLRFAVNDLFNSGGPIGDDVLILGICWVKFMVFLCFGFPIAIVVFIIKFLIGERKVPIPRLNSRSKIKLQ